MDETVLLAFLDVLFWVGMAVGFCGVVALSQMKPPRRPRRPPL
jgi:hypothetical protein